MRGEPWTREPADRSRPSTVPVPEWLQLVPGLPPSEARAAYRRRTAASMLVALAFIALLWLAAWSEIRYDVRSYSFHHTTGVVGTCVPAGSCSANQEIDYTDHYGITQSVDVGPGDGQFRNGQRVPIWYDDVCNDVLFGDSDWRATIIGDVIGVGLLPLTVIPILIWHGRRWRRLVERVVKSAKVSDWHASPVPSFTRRPLFAISPPPTSADEDLVYYLPVLSRQLAKAVRDPQQLRVLGQPANRSIVALSLPDTENVIWPAGRLRLGRWTFDRYDFARLGVIVGPQLVALAYHLARQPHTC